MSVSFKKIEEPEWGNHVDDVVLVYDKINNIWALGKMKKQQVQGFSFPSYFVSLHTIEDPSSFPEPDNMSCEVYLLKAEKKK